jgi:hypothetical protein
MEPKEASEAAKRFVGGAGLELVSDEVGKKEVAGLELAKSGTCSK